MDLIRAMQESPYREKGAVVVSCDDFDGWYDHVAPPPIDRWGPGGRVPCMIVSPWARKAHGERTPLEHSWILRFIAWRWDVAPLTAGDAAAWNMSVAFDC